MAPGSLARGSAYVSARSVYSASLFRSDHLPSQLSFSLPRGGATIIGIMTLGEGWRQSKRRACAYMNTGVRAARCLSNLTKPYSPSCRELEYSRMRSPNAPGVIFAILWYTGGRARSRRGSLPSPRPVLPHHCYDDEGLPADYQSC